MLRKESKKKSKRKKGRRAKNEKKNNPFVHSCVKNECTVRRRPTNNASNGDVKRDLKIIKSKYYVFNPIMMRGLKNSNRSKSAYIGFGKKHFSKNKILIGSQMMKSGRRSLFFSQFRSSNIMVEKIFDQLTGNLLS